MDVRVLDHLIVAGRNALSFAERGLLDAKGLRALMIHSSSCALRKWSRVLQGTG